VAEAGMKTRNTILLFLLAAGIFAFIHFYERHQPGTRDRRAAESVVLDFDRDNVDEVELINGDLKIVLRRKDNDWYLKEPVEDRVDPKVIGDLFSAAEMLSRDGVVLMPGKRDDAMMSRFKELGVARAQARLKLRGKGLEEELLLGKETPVEGKIYIRRDKDNDVLVTSAEIKRLVTMKAADYRDRRMMDFSTDAVERVAIKSAAGELVAKRDGKDWELKKPIKARGDNKTVDAFIKELAKVKIMDFGEDEEIGEIKGKLSLGIEGTNDKLVVEFGDLDASHPELVRARVSGRKGMCLIPSLVLQILIIAPGDLRDRKLARIQEEIIDRIALEPSSGSKHAFVRSGDGWKTPEGGDVDVAKVQALLAVLENTEVTRFVADVDTDLAKYGLDQPVVRVILSSYASETTAESARGERPFCTVTLGATDAGEIYARVEEEPFIVAVPAGLEKELTW